MDKCRDKLNENPRVDAYPLHASLKYRAALPLPPSIVLKCFFLVHMREFETVPALPQTINGARVVSRIAVALRYPGCRDGRLAS